MKTTPNRAVRALRKTIGRTQKEMGVLVNRAARTIQSIELGHLPLCEELALEIAEATGVDEGWLFEGRPEVPPRRGMTLVQSGKGEGVYTKADYEYYRAYRELPLLSEEGRRPEDREMTLRKIGVFENQQEIVKLIDGALCLELKMILLMTKMTQNLRLVRWRVQRFLRGLAKEFGVEVPETEISIETLKLAIPNPKSFEDVYAVAMRKAMLSAEPEIQNPKQVQKEES